MTRIAEPESQPGLPVPRRLSSSSESLVLSQLKAKPRKGLGACVPDSEQQPEPETLRLRLSLRRDSEPFPAGGRRRRAGSLALAVSLLGTEFLCSHGIQVQVVPGGTGRPGPPAPGPRRLRLRASV
jgi:hypothetical protein